MPSAVDERPDDELADDEAGPVGIHLGDRVVGGVGVQVRLAPVGIGLHEATEGRAVVAGRHVQQPEAQLVVPLDVERSVQPLTSGWARRRGADACHRDFDDVTQARCQMR